MKRVISLVIILIMLVPLAACKKAPDKEADNTPLPTETATEKPAAPTAVPTEEPTAEPEPTPVPTPVPETEPMAPADGVPAVYAGEDAYYILYPDGALWGWGRNEDGRIGNGTTEDVPFPVHIADGLTPVYVGKTVFCLSADGMLWGWGRNDGGDLGLGDTTDRTKPEEIMPFVKEINRFYDSWYALTENGDLYKWGFNAWDDTVTEEQKEAASEPSLLFEDVRSFDGQFLIKENGDVLRRLGDEYTKIASGIKRIWTSVGTAIAEGLDGKLYEFGYINGEKVKICDSFRSLAFDDAVVYVIMNDGALYYYEVGSLDGIRDVPEDQLHKMVFMMDGVKEIYAESMSGEDWGYYYRFALKENGDLWAWGLWSNDALGKSRDSEVREPELVATDVKTVSSNGYNTYIIKNDGTLWATGTDAIFSELGGEALHGEEDDWTVYGFACIPLGAKCAAVFNILRLEYGEDEISDWVILHAATFAVDEHGVIWAWGDNDGELLGILCNLKKVAQPWPVVKLMNTEN